MVVGVSLLYREGRRKIKGVSCELLLTSMTKSILGNSVTFLIIRLS